MEQKHLEQYIVPIYSGGTIVGQGFIAEGYFITAAHVIKDFPSCFVDIKGKRIELAQETPVYISHKIGDIYFIDVVVYSCDEIDSPFSFSEYIPKEGEELNCYCVNEMIDFASFNPRFELRMMPAIAKGGEEEGNYLYCHAKQSGVSCGSPLLKGNEVVGIMYGKDRNGLCAFLKAEIVKSILAAIDNENPSTEVKDEDWSNTWVDEYGVEYSGDKRRLLKAHADIENYIIRKGTRVICDDAFSWNRKLTSVTIPNSVKSIGIGAFYEYL